MTDTIEALLEENRTFAPSEEFRARARVSDDSLHREAEADPEAFWARQAEHYLTWYRRWDRVLDWQMPFARWFDGGALNASVNCVDRHVAAGRGDRVAYHWEGEPGDTRTITYAELLGDVCRFANALRALGVRRGDRVGIYLPMVPELPLAMLACARIGAAHSVVFGGFSADAVADRMNDAQAKVLITADEGWRRGRTVPLKENADNALRNCATVSDLVVVRRTGNPVAWTEGRDHWWHDLVAAQPATCEPERMESEDLLFTLYTSGTTAKPKGIKHTTAGYLLYAMFTHDMVFDIQPETVYWCTADIGWVTGHSYIVYAPLGNGCTSVMYEGTPDYPDKDRFWSIVEKYSVTVLYTAPTAIRTFMKWGPEFPARHDLSSLRLLGTVGEPINPEAWVWYRQHIGGDRTPVVDTWWQTETGGILISPLPGYTVCKPGSATRPLPGISALVVDEAGDAVPLGGGGYVVLARPWPGMLRGIWGDDERYLQTYWSKYPGRYYFAGDGARIDKDGYFWFMGRVDDVMNVAGHRISTTEVESALVDHPAVAEAAVVGRSDADSGQAISAFVTLVGGAEESTELIGELRDHVAKLIGPIARPKWIAFTPDLPKTRSGKIMRRLLRDIAENRKLGDTTTLADASVVEELQRRAQSDEAKED
ncbi:MAG TPA: acetate--CoA ligase [Candidatus Dormibacteraeota bacterium]|jgi:acetyl-CoA synthetase|nr:acetate--CoA ligase [Candidatus Dormibacteraeota bacterium]